MTIDPAVSFHRLWPSILLLCLLLTPAWAQEGEPRAVEQPQAQEETGESVPQEGASEAEHEAGEDEPIRSRPLDQVGVEVAELEGYEEHLFDPQVEQATPEGLIGRDVTNLEGENVGRIDDIVRDRQTKTLKAVIASGGLLGMAQKKVVVPLNQLHLEEEQVRLVSTISQEQLERLGAYNSELYRPVERDEQIAELIMNGPPGEAEAEGNAG